MSGIDGQLKRNRDDAIVVGVCAGLGDYFGVDPTLIRAVFIAASVVGGFGPALYVVLWILLDDADRRKPDRSATTTKVTGDADIEVAHDPTHIETAAPVRRSMVQPRP